MPGHTQRASSSARSRTAKRRCSECSVLTTRRQSPTECDSTAPRGRRRGGADLFESGVGEGLDDAAYLCRVGEVFVAVTAARLTEATRLVPGPPVVLIPPLGTKSGVGRPAGKINSRAARLVSRPLQPSNQGNFSVCPRQDSNLRHRLRRANQRFHGASVDVGPSRSRPRNYWAIWC